MGQLVFDEATAERLEKAYVAGDIVRRRQAVRAALDPKPGERILDVGCGPGFYVAEMSEIVAPSGSVVGVDPSPQMLAVAESRSADRPNVAFRAGDAVALPARAEEFDAALSIQVLEYVAKVDDALAELHRVLRPGGRLVLWDVDWSTVSWHSRHAQRMRRMLAAWDGHLADPALPRTLASRLRAAGFEDVAVEPHAFLATELSPDTYAGAIFPVLESYLRASASIPAQEISGWAEEQQELSAAGEFFFACIQFLFRARKGATSPPESR